tara:strand:- start:741 stop:1037 length:297 start_codon:yes stop_codon:yes gene_type:complete
LPSLSREVSAKVGADTSIYTYYQNRKGKVMAVKLTKVRDIEMPSCSIRDKGKYKSLVLSIEPDGGYTLRPKGTRKGGEAEVAGSFSADYIQKMWKKAS